MAITIVTPADWTMTAPGDHRTHLGMSISEGTPYVRLLVCEPHSYTAPHSHSEPEIMVVLQGRMMFNGRWCETGSVAHVPANEDYWHTTGAEGCVVALMRPIHRGKIRKAVEKEAAV